MRITLNDLEQKPSCSYFSSLYEKYQMDEPFDPIVEILSVHGERHEVLSWLMENFPEFRTQE